MKIPFSLQVLDQRHDNVKVVTREGVEVKGLHIFAANLQQTKPIVGILDQGSGQLLQWHIDGKFHGDLEHELDLLLEVNLDNIWLAISSRTGNITRYPNHIKLEAAVLNSRLQDNEILIPGFFTPFVQEDFDAIFNP